MSRNSFLTDVIFIPDGGSMKQAGGIVYDYVILIKQPGPDN